MDNAIIQHTFLKFDQNRTNPGFSIKNPEPQMKQENPRSSEKSPAVATLTVTVCAKKCFCTRTSSRKIRKHALRWC